MSQKTRIQRATVKKLNLEFVFDYPNPAPKPR
jgi:hypothetical protein